MNPFLITDNTAISFSGGRTSAYLLWKVLQENKGLPDCARVLFCNTGKEDEATLDFIHACETKWNVPIVWLEYRPDSKFEVVDYESASRGGGNRLNTLSNTARCSQIHGLGFVRWNLKYAPCAATYKALDGKSGTI
jgi:3'-phosphoadenosine 5'-phosphosulfate sulfotransferase (PAPS reductase)/FAD synthetase